MKRIIPILLIASCITGIAIPPADASVLGTLLGVKIASKVATKAAKSVTHGIFHGGDDKKFDEKEEKDIKQPKKEFTEKIPSSEWSLIARDERGSVYFHQESLQLLSADEGFRKVSAVMQHTFTKKGAEALYRAGDGQLEDDHPVSYALFTITYGERKCELTGPVTYYDEEGNILLETGEKEALPDITGRNYGNWYLKDSREEQEKDRIFSAAFAKKEPVPPKKQEPVFPAVLHPEDHQMPDQAVPVPLKDTEPTVKEALHP